jgi:hypothetical protein
MFKEKVFILRECFSGGYLRTGSLCQESPLRSKRGKGVMKSRIYISIRDVGGESLYLKVQLVGKLNYCNPSEARWY